MKFLILILTTVIFCACLELVPDLEPSVFEEESSIQVIEITSDLTQRYLANEWETFIYMKVDTSHVYSDMYILVFKDNVFYKHTTINWNGAKAQFYDKAPFNSSHCYSFSIANSTGVSRRLTPEYCIDFK